MLCRARHNNMAVDKSTDQADKKPNINSNHWVKDGAVL